MKRLALVLICLGLAVWGGLTWFRFSFTNALKTKPVSPVAAQVAAPDSAFFEASGVVGAGGETPVLANVTGRVRKVYFVAGEYARPGQVLAKLYNYSYIVAPRAGFLGPRQIASGQFVTTSTEVTTLSRRSHLVVSLQLPAGRRAAVHPGDSAEVWVEARATRVARGVVAPFALARTDTVEIFLPSRAPFRIGEQARVRLKNAIPQLTMQ